MTSPRTVTLTTPSDREVVMTRVFDAPRRLVFEALSTPALLKRWMLTPGRQMEVCDIDFRAGGAYRFVWRGPDTTDVCMHGIYREIVKNERIVRTELWEDWVAGEALITAALTEENDETTMTTTVQFATAEVRDQMLKTGMEQGANASFDRLANCLTQMQAS